MFRPNAFFAPLLSVLLISTFLFAPNAMAETDRYSVDGGNDIPGAGYRPGDECGFILGTESRDKPELGGGRLDYGNMHMHFYNPDEPPVQEVAANSTPCFDLNGYFYNEADGENDSIAVLRTGDADVNGNGEIDPEEVDPAYSVNFTWSLSRANHVNIDWTTGAVTGYAQVTGALLGGEEWLWMDWACQDEPWCARAADFRVRVDLEAQNPETGRYPLRGFAWSDRFGWVSFNGLEIEAPPRVADVFVDILTLDEESGEWILPSQVGLSNAPQADTFDYWRVRAQFFDRLTGDSLPVIAMEDVYFDITKWGEIDLNILDNRYDYALIEGPEHPSVSGCTSLGLGEACLLWEDGRSSRSINTFLSSGAPTSNMLGVKHPSLDFVEYPSSRDGCVGFFDAPVFELFSDSLYSAPGRSIFNGSEVDCLSGDAVPDEFFNRADAGNYLEIPTVNLSFSFGDLANEFVLVAAGEEFYASEEGSYNIEYHFDDTQEISFKPRVQSTLFEFEDGSLSLPEPDAAPDSMTLEWSVDVMPNSLSYNFANYGDEDLFRRRSGPSVQIWAHAERGVDARRARDIRYYAAEAQLLLDPSLSLEESFAETLRDYVDIPAWSIGQGMPRYLFGNTTVSSAEVDVWGDNVNVYYGTMALPLEGEEPEWYPAAPTTLENPVLEQIVCDNVGAERLPELSSSNSCYPIAYLPRHDRFADPEPIKILGTLSSGNVDAVSFLSDLLSDADYSLLGQVSSELARNQMQRQVARYTLGESAGAGTLGADMTPEFGSDIRELLGGRILYANGDVTITGSDSFMDKTLIVEDGNVYIDGNVSGAQLGIVTVNSGLRSLGNVYVAPNVTDLFANMFLEGALLSYDGATKEDGFFIDWPGERTEILGNQLYIRGSLFSVNMVGVNPMERYCLPGDAECAEDPEGRDYGFTFTRELDINRLRRYRQCNVIEDGLLVGTEPCDAGELLSEQYPLLHDGDVIYNSLILEYISPASLPVFGSI